MAAGLIQGDPTAPVGGITAAIVFQQWTSGVFKLYLQYGSIPARFAKRLDEELDNGKGNSGKIVCTFYCASGASWSGDDVVVNVMVAL